MISMFALVSFSTVHASNKTFVQNSLGSKSCWQFVESVGGRVYSHASRGRYANKLDCKVTIIAPKGNQIVLHIENFDVTDSMNCYQDEVIFYDGRRNSSPQLSGSLYGLCGSTVPEEYRYMVSSGNEATIRFITDGVSTENSGFVVSYTAFIPSIKKKEEDDCFQCAEDPMCIDPRLKCDGLANCIDGSDESMATCYYGRDSNDNTDGPSYNWLSWPGTLLAFVFISCYIIAIVVNCAVCRCNSSKYDENGQEPNVPAARGIRHSDPAVSQVMLPTEEGCLSVQIEDDKNHFDKRSATHTHSSSSRSGDVFPTPSSPRGRGDGSYGRPMSEEMPLQPGYVRPPYPTVFHEFAQPRPHTSLPEHLHNGRYQWDSNHHVISVTQNSF